MSELHEQPEPLDLPPEELTEQGPASLADVDEQPPEQPQARPAPQEVQRTPPSREQLDQAATNIIETVAELGSATLPAHLQDAYYDAYTHNKLVKRGLLATGLPAALEELAPTDGSGVGPVRQLHPIIRVVAGLAVLALGSILTRNAVLNAPQN